MKRMTISGLHAAGAVALGIAEAASVTEGDRAWVSRALCRGKDPDELFVRGAAQRKAAAICRHCPVMQECAAEALDNKVEYGVWGGMTERQRRALLNQHPEVVSWADFLDKRKYRRIAGQRPRLADQGSTA
jgi:WhiB family redox-sensing transcriptional regulator